MFHAGAGCAPEHAENLCDTSKYCVFLPGTSLAHSLVMHVSGNHHRIDLLASATNARLWAWLLALSLVSSCATTLEDQGPSGTELTLYAGQEVVLDASSIFAGAGTYHWEQLSGPTVPIPDPSVSVLRFTAPDVSELTFIILSLTTVQEDVSAKTVFTVTVVPEGDPFPDSGPEPTPDAGTGSSSPDAELEQPDVAAGQYAAMLAENTPTIDGELSEFANAPAIDLSPSSGTTAVHKLLWSNTHLYVAASVIDGDVQTTNATRDGAIWNDDNIELMFDIGGEGGTNLSSGDFKVIINADGVRRDGEGSATGSFDASWNPAYQVAAVPTADGYQIEMAIPWSAFGLAGAPAAAWGFDTAQNDRNAAGQTSKAVWWNQNGGGVNDPAGWGELSFSTLVAPPGAAEPTDPEPTDPEPTDPEPTDPEPTDPEPTPLPTGKPIGFGRNTTGGAGGASYVVTNLQDSGDGSLRAGAESSGAKVITFAVSGTITLSKPIRPTANKTIDGAGKAVTVKAPNGSTISGFILEQDNVIVRNLTVQGGGARAGGGEGREDGFTVYGASNVWIDHNRIHGWNDKGIGMPVSSNVTISWNEFYANEHSILVGTNATASAQVNSRTTVHHNYMHDSADRHPKINGGGHTVARMHAFNNYVKNWGYGSAGPAMISVGAAQLLAERNIFQTGGRGGDKAVCPTCSGKNADGAAKVIDNWLMDGSIYEIERLPGTVFDPKGIYNYQAETANETLRQKIMAGVGPNQ